MKPNFFTLLQTFLPITDNMTGPLTVQDLMERNRYVFLEQWKTRLNPSKALYCGSQSLPKFEGGYKQGWIAQHCYRLVSHLADEVLIPPKHVLILPGFQYLVSTPECSRRNSSQSNQVVSLKHLTSLPLFRADMYCRSLCIEDSCWTSSRKSTRYHRS